MSASQMQEDWSTSPFYGGNAAYIEGLYESYLRDPNSVPEHWRVQFDKMPRVSGQIKQDVPHDTVREHFLGLARNRSRAEPLGQSAITSEHDKKQVAVTQMVAAYRVRGHQRAELDPLGLMQRDHVPDLELGHHGLTESDLDSVFNTGNLCIGKEEATLGEIFQAINDIYCTSVGAEYMHIVDTAEKRWIQQRMEGVRSSPSYSAEVKRHLLERLVAAEGLEKSLASKFPGFKRFGLEGGESLIPLLDEAIQRSGSYGIKEIVIGMAHRGRLNVLVNILGKNPSELFGEFEGKRLITNGSGDVKYHQGFSSNVLTSGGEVHLALAFNPSHLEIVAPVVAGSVRARQDRRTDSTGDQVTPIMIHGDAAFAGQGVVMETFQMSQTRAYSTGGTLHIIVNNQVGFTTSNQADARSTEYCTDVAKMVQAPIFHVNGDDPEAVLFVTQMAVDFRKEFKKDVVIDLVCYRRHGHNETDEPSGTQPLMYGQIRKHLTVRSKYALKLQDDGTIGAGEADDMSNVYRNLLEQGAHVVKSLVTKPNKALFVDWSSYVGHDYIAYADTTVDIKKLTEIAFNMAEVPEGFVVQRQVMKIVEDRKKMAAGALPINWGFAETMAYATLLSEGYPIRFSGQDSGRGTFSHRHAVLYNQKDAQPHIPLKEVASEAEVRFDIYDSFLSEEAVLAFEYGYATTSPSGLVIWEAQFGDFANGAQVVIDQFISSGEHKWSRLCGLVMLLPHGYEGQGPEHSSARLERFLQLCAEHNMQICIPTTPAQMFHMMRRQAVRPLRKPLIVMSPKSLLRHKACVSTLEDLSEGSFQMVLPEIEDIDPDKVDRVIMCSGRVYYDLVERRQAEGWYNAAIIRIEQLYPFPEEELYSALSLYPNLQYVVWCQEEPMNQGAWFCSQHHMRNAVKKIEKDINLLHATRDASAAPASGYMSMHVEEQQKLVLDAFRLT